MSALSKVLRPLAFAVAVPALAALAACASTTAVMMAPARPPIDPAQVRLYPATPPGAQEIAQIEATSPIGFGSQEQVDAAIKQLKNSAAHVGANGIVLVGTGSQTGPGGVSVGVGSFGRSFGSSVGFGIPTTQKKATGVAIWVPDNIVAPPAATGTPAY